ncbi:fibronectin type III-like domain-containing protein [Daldinia grandis]|nr:fibronectin type III-like domain-containing protein [Daldinia grandis]
MISEPRQSTTDNLNPARAYPDPGSVSEDGSMKFGHDYLLQSPLSLYEDSVASVVVPSKQLRGFSKIFVPAGSTGTVQIDIAVANFGLWDIGMKYVVEPGEFTIHAGSSSNDLRTKAKFTVV